MKAWVWQRKENGFLIPVEVCCTPLVPSHCYLTIERPLWRLPQEEVIVTHKHIHTGITVSETMYRILVLYSLYRNKHEKIRNWWSGGLDFSLQGDVLASSIGGLIAPHVPTEICRKDKRCILTCDSFLLATEWQCLPITEGRAWIPVCLPHWTIHCFFTAQPQERTQSFKASFLAICSDAPCFESRTPVKLLVALWQHSSSTNTDGRPDFKLFDVRHLLFSF